MPDDGDYSSAGEIDHINMTLAAHRERIQKAGPSLFSCLECGDEIPERRREAMPGCEHCVKCQAWLNKGHKFYP